MQSHENVIHCYFGKLDQNKVAKAKHCLAVPSIELLTSTELMNGLLHPVL